MYLALSGHSVRQLAEIHIAMRVRILGIESDVRNMRTCFFKYIDSILLKRMEEP